MFIACMHPRDAHARGRGWQTHVPATVSCCCTDHKLAVVTVPRNVALQQGTKDDDWRLAKMDINNRDFKIFKKKSALQIFFMRKNVYSTYLIDLKDTHNALW